MRCPIYCNGHIWHLMTSNLKHAFFIYEQVYDDTSFICKSRFCEYVLGFRDDPFEDVPPGYQWSLF